VVRPRSCRVIYYFDTPALGIRHQLFDRVISWILYPHLLLDRHVNLRGVLSQILNIWDKQRTCGIMACVYMHAILEVKMKEMQRWRLKWKKVQQEMVFHHCKFYVILFLLWLFYFFVLLILCFMWVEPICLRLVFPCNSVYLFVWTGLAYLSSQCFH